MTFQNPDSSEIKRILSEAKTIAVVGLSPRADRPSHGVAAAMQRFGYRIIPVRPAVDEVLGEKAYAELRELPEVPDIVDVFRAPEHIPAIVDDVIAIGARVLWLQEGVVNVEEAERARRHGITVVMDRCIYKERAALRG
ncbi:MAG TPA: CoA-binding protein [Gammaproteobacteria bacterium]|nr:CoA-binding protein [Gammaproteobacteria bacterium]